MNFIWRNFWALVGVSAAVAALSLGLGIGGPAAAAGIVLGMLLMLKAGQKDPAPDLKGWTDGQGTGPGAEPAP